VSRRPARLLAEDILEAVERIRTYTAGLNRTQFVGDQLRIDAVVRNLEIIGEAANRLPEDARARCPQIEWPKIVGLRNRIVHDYFGVDVDIIWQILQVDLEPLRNAVLGLVAELPST
jgi:uncharacterized protein with HEPN domain